MSCSGAPQRFGWGLVIALLVAPACNRQQSLPSYGPLPAFSLQDQQGRTRSEHDLSGHVVVVDFIFTSCPDVCPLLTEQLRALQKQFPNAADVRWLSISVDPEHDTPERLRQFARQHDADQADWWFLTGPVEQVKRVVTQGFKQAMEAQPTAAGKPANVLHGTHFVLIDRSGAIRGFYASDEEGRGKLRGAIATLLADRGAS